MPDKEVDSSKVPTKELLARYEEAKQARYKYDEFWDRNYNLYISKHWLGVAKIWFQTEPVFNKVFEFVEIMRSMLSDRKWGIDSVPAVAPDSANEEAIEAKSEKINKLLDFLWAECRLQGKLAQTLLHVFLKGTGFMKVSFDPENISNRGIGQIDVDVVDPQYIYVDPDATSVHDAAFIIEAKPVSLRYLMRRYPDKWQEIAKSGAGSSLNLAPQGSETSGPPAANEGKRMDIYECWYHDATVMELEDNGDTVKVGAKYPNGRYTLMTANGVVLEDKPNPYKVFPYVRFVEIPMPGQFWGGCTLEKAAEIQMGINQLLRAIIDNGLWIAHGIWVADSTSGVTPKTLAGYGPRDVVIKHPGTEVRRDTGAALPGHLFQTLLQMVEAFDQVVGIPNVLRGIVPSRQPVATTEQMRESGEVRTRERARRVEESLQDLGELLLMVVADSWVDKRVVRASKQTGGFEYFKLTKKDFDGWEFAVQIVPGSTLPMDIEGQFSRMMDMRDKGVQIPDKFLLKFSNIPGLLSSIAEMEAQAEAAQGPQGEQGPPQEQVPMTADQFGMEDPDPAPGDQMPTQEDLASLDPQIMAEMESQGGLSNFP